MVVVEKSTHRRWHSESRTLSRDYDHDRNSKKDAFIREKRNPLLDRVKDTKLSCFQSSEVLSQFQDDGQSSRMDLKLINHSQASEECFNEQSESNSKCDRNHKKKDNSTDNEKSSQGYTKNSKTSKMRKRNTETNESFNANSCLGAKLKSISDRLLKSSTNRILAKLYKNNDVDTEKKGRGSKKLRSFSYGALPGLEEFHNKGNPLYVEYDCEIGHNDKILLVEGSTMPDGEDGDSGILVNDSTSCVVDAIERMQISHSRSASGEQSVQNSECKNRDSWSSDRSSLRSLKNARKKRLTKRSVSLDRREVLKSYHRQSRLSSEGDDREEEAEEEGSKEVPTTPCKRVFKVIRLFRSSPDEELGIFIAKTKLADQGAPGYLIAHIVPDGLAHR